MRLGAALSQRAKLAQRMNDLKGRIKTNVLVQEGTTPSEDPHALIADYVNTSARFRVLVQRIAEANASTMIAGRSLLAMLQEREQLIRLRNLYGMAADSATPGIDRYRYMRTELAYTTTVDVAELRRQEDDLNQQVRIIDELIQQTNWETDIPE